MENWGLVTYREVDLLIDPTTATSGQRQRVCTVVTHELAHQCKARDGGSRSFSSVPVSRSTLGRRILTCPPPSPAPLHPGQGLATL